MDGFILSGPVLLVEMKKLHVVDLLRFGVLSINSGDVVVVNRFCFKTLGSLWGTGKYKHIRLRHIGLYQRLRRVWLPTRVHSSGWQMNMAPPKIIPGLSHSGIVQHATTTINSVIVITWRPAPAKVSESHLCLWISDTLGEFFYFRKWFACWYCCLG